MTYTQSFYISFFTNIILTIVLVMQLSISKARIHVDVQDAKDIHLNNANNVIQPRRRYNSNEQPKFSDIMDGIVIGQGINKIPIIPHDIYLKQKNY